MVIKRQSLKACYNLLFLAGRAIIRLGAWYLANLENEFAGNSVIVLAAYNGGRGNVHKWLEEDKISGSARDIEMIPFPETKNFVRKVLWNYRIYKWLYSDNDMRNNG